MRSAYRLAAYSCCAMFLIADLATAQLDPDFMPRGGKSILLEILAAGPAGLQLIKDSASGKSEADWKRTVAALAAGLSDKEQQTLAIYLSVNAPLDAAAIEKAAQPGQVAPLLPMDGRELAWEYCQSCHSLFSGYLTQERDAPAWLNTFASPFHREIKMTQKQREEFARYSAINMPMKFEDVPEELRF